MSLFGTDGVRGAAGFGPLSAGNALRLAGAFSQALRDPGPVLVARDTRESGGMLLGAVQAGLAGSGREVHDLGVLPTPGLSVVLAQTPGAAGGVMITASHNPYLDNGLKLFGPSGAKVAHATQDETEARWRSPLHAGGLPDRAPGPVRDRSAEAERRYLASLDGVAGLTDRIVVADAAAGAASRMLPAALAASGASVVVSSPAPDGRNINAECGAVHPEALARRVVAEGAFAGVAVDGDGDRVAIADERGDLHDGDAILGVLAARWAASGALRGGAVVGTKTSNSGLDRFVSALGLRLLRSDVGDRYVAAMMEENGCNLGGEGSGHVLTPDLCPTGDGIRVGLLVLQAAVEQGCLLSQLFAAIPVDPSVQRAVRVSGRPPLDRLPSLQRALWEAEQELAPLGGRTLLRYSGTEPVLRVLVEGPGAALVAAWAERLAVVAAAAIDEACRGGGFQ